MYTFDITISTTHSLKASNSQYRFPYIFPYMSTMLNADEDEYYNALNIWFLPPCFSPKRFNVDGYCHDMLSVCLYSVCDASVL